MKKFIFILLLFSITVLAQANNKLTGVVRGVDGKAIPFANVVILELQKVTNADAAGIFVLPNIPSGTYTLKVYLDGYNPESQNFNVTADKNIEVILKRTSLRNNAVVVTGHSRITDALTSVQSVSVIEGREVDKKRGQTIVSLMEGTPGVSSVSTGAGIAKPVIRGLFGQRILVLTDGVRQEDQQFGDEHSLDLDSYGVEKIEILRGPASLLYGSDALGGVINVIRLKAPRSSARAGRMESKIHYNAQSENNSDAAGIDVYGKNDLLGYRIMTSGKKGAKVETARGRLHNTGMKEENKSVSLGADGSWGSFYLDAFKRSQKQELYKNPNSSPGATPYQLTNHDKIHLNSVFLFTAGDLESDFAYQRNHRREVEDKNVYLPDVDFFNDPTTDIFSKTAYGLNLHINPEKNGLNLNLDSASGDIRFRHREIMGTTGTVGVSVMNQKNSSIGSEHLIPSYTMSNVAAYIQEQYKSGDFTFLGGVRTDKRILSVLANDDLGNLTETRNYYANTGSAGTVYRMTKHSSVALNYGRGFRAPTPFELYANGIHEGSGRFEAGNHDLKPEFSRSADLALRYITQTTRAELNYYRNRIENYIYASASPLIDESSALPVYKYRQDLAIISGVELDLEHEIFDWLNVSTAMGFIRAKNIQTGNWLPMIPADNGKLGFKIFNSSFWKFHKPYFEIKGRFYQKQTRLDPGESRTASYNLYDAGMGFELQAISRNGENAVFDLEVTNIMNTPYVSHLNRYKTYALNPGTNIGFKLTIPFSVME